MKWLVSLFALCSGVANASFLPPNNLHLQKQKGFGGITQAQFDKVISEIEAVFKPVVASHGAVLKVNRLWTNPTVNANASQSGNVWTVNMYGGLARRTEVTEDGFAMVLCHELGHHLGGFAFYQGDTWAANEGQSDYFSAQVCARKMWLGKSPLKLYQAVDPAAKAKCDAAYLQDDERGFCYRASIAGQSLANLLAALEGNSSPKYSTPDKSVVRSTNDAHPRAQCRLDTYLAGAACTKSFDLYFIPGKEFSNKNSKEAELQAYQYSCSQYEGFSIGTRPKCWFAPKVGNFEGLADVGSP